MLSRIYYYHPDVKDIHCPFIACVRRCLGYIFLSAFDVVRD